MPACPQCGKEWPEGYAVCPDDGIRLSIVQTSVTQSGALALAESPARNDELPAGSLAGEYQIEKKLGQGGMGVVYGARHPVIGKRAAIKVIAREMSASQDAVDRFVREAQAVNQIGHPNIVDVFGFGKLPDGRSFFVMEWLQGESLRERMRRPLPLPEALEILEQIATALQAAHEAGVLHRDLKPDNVFLQHQKGQPPKVKLLDFGLAKLQGSGESRIDHTRTGVVMGTPLYLSPEQAKGTKVDLAADVYSLGALAYEMASGQVPFMADSAVEIMAKHISERVVPLFQLAPHTPPALDALVLAMLDKDPRRRPLIDQVRDQLSTIRAQLATNVAAVSMRPFASPLAAVGTPPPEELAQTSLEMKKSRRGLVIALVAGGVIAAGAAAIFVFGGGGSSSSESQTASLEPAKPEPAKTEPAKTEPAKTEPAKTEPAKTEPAKTEPAEPAKTEPAKTEPAKTTPKKTTSAPTSPATDKQVGSVTVQLEGVPRGRIWIDGRLTAVGVTETNIELAPGDHRVHAESPQHLPANETVHVVGGKKQTVKLQLKPRRSQNGVYDPFD